MERYDTIGVAYAARRREDPAIRAAIHSALGDARTVVNVGAGTGLYEPEDRHVMAIEPSDVMAAQRPANRAPAIRARAADLPLRDGAADAAMALLTVHHWDADLEAGLSELRRVARGPVVVLTFDAPITATTWLHADYLPEVVEREKTAFPSLALLAERLGGEVEVVAVPLARETPDQMLAAFWGHPERVLDPEARAATSGFALLPDASERRAVAALARDLQSGAWDARHGHLRAQAQLDVGLRLVVARPASA